MNLARVARCLTAAYVLLVWNRAHAAPYGRTTADMYRTYNSTTAGFGYRYLAWRALLPADPKLPMPLLPAEAVLWSPALATSTRAVAGSLAAAVAPAAPSSPNLQSFVFRAAYVFPNPSRHGAAVTFRLQAGRADSASLSVYNFSGRRVLETGMGSPTTLDDGNGLGPQITYSQSWSPTGSGMFMYVIVARKSGQSDIVRTGKFAVVK